MTIETEITVAELKKARYALGDKMEALAREFEAAHGVLIAEIELARVQYFDGMHGKEKLSVCVRLDV